MPEPDAPWYSEWTFGDSTTDRVMAAFGQHALPWSRLGWTPDDVHAEFDQGTLAICVDVSDAQLHSIVRCLRAEYDGRRVLIGDDPTGQYVRPLVEHDPHVSRHDVLDASPEEVGRAIAEWIGLELRRPIYREEWDRPPERFTRWVLGDVGRELCWRSRTKERPTRLDTPARRLLVAGIEDSPTGG